MGHCQVSSWESVENLELNVFSLLKPHPVAFDSSVNRFDQSGKYKQDIPGKRTVSMDRSWELRLE